MSAAADVVASAAPDLSSPFEPSAAFLQRVFPAEDRSCMYVRDWPPARTVSAEDIESIGRFLERNLQHADIPTTSLHIGGAACVQGELFERVLRALHFNHSITHLQFSGSTQTSWFSEPKHLDVLTEMLKKNSNLRQLNLFHLQLIGSLKSSKSTSMFAATEAASTSWTSFIEVLHSYPLQALRLPAVQLTESMFRILCQQLIQPSSTTTSSCLNELDLSSLSLSPEWFDHLSSALTNSHSLTLLHTHVDHATNPHVHAALTLVNRNREQAGMKPMTLKEPIATPPAKKEKGCCIS